MLNQIKPQIWTVLPVAFFCLLRGFAANASTNSAHAFQTASWSQGLSCVICHMKKKGAPRLIPPGGRVVDYFATFSDTEKKAIELHPSNRLCYACHDTNKNSGGTTVGHSNAIDLGDSDQVPRTSNTTLPPSIGSGNFGSITVRVTNQGAKGLDCLACHDVHNFNTKHLLRAEYNGSKTTR